LTRAFQLRDRASEREKLQIAGTYYEDVTGEWRNAVDALEELVQSYPRLQEGMEANPYAMLGDLYEMHGMYEEAVDEGVSRVLCNRPRFVFGDGAPGKGAVSLPRLISVEVGCTFIAEFSPEPASVPATES